MKQNIHGITLQKPLKHSVEDVTGSKMTGGSSDKSTAAPLPETSRELVLKEQSTHCYDSFTDTDKNHFSFA
jgi:hypothetical protein